MKLFKKMYKWRNFLQIQRHFCKCVETDGGAETLQRLGIVGVPQNKGQGKVGVEMAPDALRKSNLVETLKKISGNKIIKDYGNLTYSSADVNQLENMKNLSDVYACNNSLFAKVNEMLQENDQFLVLGGDHSIAVGSVCGHLEYDPNLALIWIDAHADINLNTTSDSGNIHGMPVSFILEELKDFWSEQEAQCFRQRLPAKRLAYIGLRDVDPYESYMLQALGITTFAMNAIDEHGIAKVMEMVFKRIDPENKLNYHISFDIDSLDIKEAPSTGTAVPGGLTLREGIYIMEKFAETGRIRGVDLVEVNPKIGSQDEVQRTLIAAVKIIKAAFGHSRSGNIKKPIHIDQLMKLT